MSHDPIARLLAEHVELQRRLSPLREVLPALETGDAAVLERALPVLHDVSRMMSSDLIAHARREDDIFFPAVEQAIGAGFGPTQVMRMEHSDIHRGTDVFRDTLRELQEEDHPAIVEAGERLEGQLASGGGGERLAAIARDLLERIDAHFAKEEQVLFPMTRQLLDGGALRDVARQMDEADARANP